MPDDSAVTKTNAAKRLHEALLAMKAVPGSYQQGAAIHIRSGLDALPMAMNLTPDERMPNKGWALMRAVKVFAEMINDTRAEVDQMVLSQEDKDFYLRDIPKLTEVLSPHNLAQSWNDTAARITLDTLANIEHLDRVLNRNTQERKLSSEDFESLLNEILEAQQALKHLDIDDRLKIFIGNQLANIRLAVDEYKFRGISGVQPAIAGYLGALGLANAELEQAAQTPEGESGLKKLLEVCKMGASLLNTAKGVAWVWPYLSHGAHVIAQLAAHTV